MAYEKYMQIWNKEDFYKSWKEKQADNLAAMTGKMKDYIYEKYLLKCRIFNRDSFRCQNIELGPNGEALPCPYCNNAPFYPKLTMHHIKFKKNGGEDKERNTVTVCRPAHAGFHKGRNPLIFPEKSNLPPHIKGHTFNIDMGEAELDWKAHKSKMKQLRLILKNEIPKSARIGGWHKLLMEELEILMKWLTVPYYEWDPEGEEDDDEE